MSFTSLFLDEVKQVVDGLDRDAIDRAVAILASLRDTGGRLFILGVGGSAGNASHAVNDFRKLCGIETYAPTDNVSELTARANDEGWATIFSGWLKISNIASRDVVMVFSVGGGDLENNVSPNLGQGYIIDSFMVVVFGGVGNLWGTLVSALTLGIVNKFLEPIAGAVLGKITVLVLLILFIQRKPRGLFPIKGRAVEA